MAGRMGQSRGQGASWATQEFSGPLFFPPRAPKNRAGPAEQGPKTGPFSNWPEKKWRAGRRQPGHARAENFPFEKLLPFFCPSRGGRRTAGGPARVFFLGIF